MNIGSRSSVSLRRANLLLSQGRYADAEEFFRAALAEDANDPTILGQFSLCLGCQGKNKEGLRALERALVVTPDVAGFHAQKALLLADEQRFEAATQSAEEAMRLDPDLALAHAASAEIFAGGQKWKRAETAAREALMLDPGSLLAQNVLSHALLMLGKREENEATLALRLAEDPENPYTHCNVGRAALRRGDYQTAQEHFKVALGLDPSIDEAREGLLDAFRSRSVLYRGFLAMSFFVGKFSNKERLLLVCGVLVGFHLLYRTFSQIAPMLGLALALFYFLFVLWSFVGRGLGTLIVLSDRSARHALTPRDFREGIFGGGSLVLGILIAIAGIVVRRFEVALFGGALAGCSLPLAVMFRNSHPRGARLYPAIAAVAVGATALLGINAASPGLILAAITSSSLIAVAVAVASTTWLVNLSLLFETR